MSNLQNNEYKFLRTKPADDDLKTLLNNLNEKLNSVTREVSFWDVYNITQVLLSDNDILSKLPLLNIGEGAIVNANMLSEGSEIHYRGDLAYRKSDGQLIWIPAENKGIYTPSISLEGNQLKLTYSYSSDIPDQGEQSSISIDMQQEQSYAIDVYVDRSTYTFPAITFFRDYGDDDFETVELRPIVKFYVRADNGIEDLYLDWHWHSYYDGEVLKITITIEDGYPTGTMMRVR